MALQLAPLGNGGAYFFGSLISGVTVNAGQDWSVRHPERQAADQTERRKSARSAEASSAPSSVLGNRWLFDRDLEAPRCPRDGRWRVKSGGGYSGREIRPMLPPALPWLELATSIPAESADRLGIS